MNTKLEIQEHTFQHISREIHDNISLSLTLAKLNLHTIDWENHEKTQEKIENSIGLLSQSITQLSDLSKSLDADIINRHSLIQALEEELQRIRKSDLLAVHYEVTGTPVFMESRSELVIFRIIQEAFNNIIKHAGARTASLLLHYNEAHLKIDVTDDGHGFDPDLQPNGAHAGLSNIRARVKLLGGQMSIVSRPGAGTVLHFNIPISTI